MGCHALLQGIFPTLGLDLCRLCCRQILYHLSHQGGPFRELKYSSVQRASGAFGHLATPHHKVIYHKGFQGPCSVGVRCFQFMRNEEGYPLEQTLGTTVYQTIPGSRESQFSSVQSLSHVRLFATPWTAACQASLSITISRSSLRLTSFESVMPSSHLILCHPLLLLSPIPPSIRVFSHESTLRMRWSKYWSFSFSIIPSKEILGLISFRMDYCLI